MVQCHPPLEIQELPKEDEERLEKLFSKLDADGNGKIDIHDLSVALKELAPHINRSYAEKFLAKTGKDPGDVTLSEFIHYVREHEKNLRLQFSHLDKNKDGKVDLEELISAFADLGIAIGRNEATNLLKRMDQDGSLNISYDEWRDYLLLAPATDIHALIHFWRHSTFLCALHFFGHGSYQRSLCNDTNYKISQSTSCRAISEVVEALNSNIILKKFINFPNSSLIRDIVLRNYESFGIPGVLGYIDGTHISLKKPIEHEELYVNRKGDHSINAQMVCDSSLKILNVCAKYPGSTHDSFMWRFSAVRRRMMDINNQSNICWLLGDSGYPLEPWLLTPILNASPNTPENRYTTAHILSRNCIERCFGVLKSRFRCLKRKMEYDPQKVGCIVNACAVLHNVCITAGLPLPEIVLEEDNLVINTEERIRNRELYQRGLVARQHLIERVFD